MTLNFSPTCNIQELLYDNRRLSEIVMELNNKIISLQNQEIYKELNALNPSEEAK